MIVKSLKGHDTQGLVRYLFGPGRFNEHTSPHVVAGSAVTQQVFSDLVVDGEVLSGSEQRMLADHLDQHWLIDRAVNAPGTQPVRTAKTDDPPHVWHTILSVKRDDDGILGSDKWRAIAHDYIELMGLGECEWAAVHHGQSTDGNDHIHVVVNRVQADGTWASIHNDWKRSMEAARDIEERHNLTRAKDRGVQRGMPGYGQGERRRARAEGGPGDRFVLEQKVRLAAAQVATEVEFVEALRRLGVKVRPRYVSGGRERVIGYSVSTGKPAANGKPLWFGGGRLAPDLTLPKMRERWGHSDPELLIAAWQNRDTAAPSRGPRPVGDEPQRVSREAERILAALARQDARDARAWRAAAGDTAAWSIALGVQLNDPALLRAGRDLTRSALPERGGPSAAPRSMDMVRMMRLITTGQSHDRGWLAVVESLLRATQAIADAHRARGELTALRRVTRAMATIDSTRPARAAAEQTAARTQTQRDATHTKTTAFGTLPGAGTAPRPAGADDVAHKSRDQKKKGQGYER